MVNRGEVEVAGCRRGEGAAVLSDTPYVAEAGRRIRGVGAGDGAGQGNGGPLRAGSRGAGDRGCGWYIVDCGLSIALTAISHGVGDRQSHREHAVILIDMAGTQSAGGGSAVAKVPGVCKGSHSFFLRSAKK